MSQVSNAVRKLADQIVNARTGPLNLPLSQTQIAVAIQTALAPLVTKARNQASRFFPDNGCSCGDCEFLRELPQWEPPEPEEVGVSKDLAERIYQREISQGIRRIGQDAETAIEQNSSQHGDASGYRRNG